LLSDITQTGLYENADKIVLVPFTVITALGTVMLPRMSNIIAQGDEEKSRLYIRDSMQFVLCLSVAMMFGLAAIGEIFAPLYFGEAFTESGILIKYLSSVVVIAAWANVIRTQYLIPKEKDSIYVISVILGAVANLILNFIFIPKYGALGAVIGTIAAEGSVMLYQSIMTRKELQFSQYFNDNFLFLISGGIMYISLRIISKYIKDGYGELIFLIILGMLIYGIMTFILFYLFKRDRLMHFKKYFKVKKKD
jgi:O-antigen/teichoic acid export membrane protein